MKEVENYFMKSVANGNDTEKIDQYEIMKSYLAFGNGVKIKILSFINIRF